MRIDLGGQPALITGSASGTGYAIAKALAEAVEAAEAPSAGAGGIVRSIQ